MFAPRTIVQRLTVLMILSLLALAAATNASARVLPDGGGPAPQSEPAAVQAAAGGFDWSRAGLVAVVALAFLVVTIGLIRVNRNGKKGKPLAAR